MTIKEQVFQLYKNNNFSEILKILDYDLSDPDLIQLKSQCYFALGDRKLSYRILTESFEKHFFHVNYFKNFINLTNRVKEFRKSLVFITKIIKKIDRKKLNDFYLIEISKLYYILNKHYLSNKYYKKILNLKNIKNKSFINFHLGKNLLELGQKNEGMHYIRKGIEENNTFGEFYRFLSMNKKFENELDPDLNKMLELYDNKNLLEKDKASIGFALAKAYEDIKDYKKSAKFLSECNYLVNKRYNYNHDQTINQYENLKKIYLENFKQQNLSKYGFQNNKSIFIVGMPRSGSTLLDRIVSNHSQVISGGELSFFSKYFNGTFDEISKKDFNFGLKNFNQNLLKNIGKGYDNEVNLVTNKILTDKMPFNFVYTGFIKQALPNSKILHIKRDRNDNILSIYKNFFSTSGIQFAYQEEFLNLYYDAYLDLMTFWKEYCEDFYMDVSYEDLITKKEKTIKEVISFLELDWEESCLVPETNKNFIKTLSVAQARNKINNQSIESYKKFEPYLPNLFR